MRRYIVCITAALLLLAGVCHAAQKVETPATAGAFVNLGIEFYGKMKYEKAASYFHEALKSRPSRSLRNLIAYGLKVLETNAASLKEIEALNNQLKTAAAEQKQAIIAQLINAHTNMGKRLLGAGGYVAIVKTHFDYVISQDPLNVEAYSYLGDINYLSMLYEGAIKHYRKALEIDPSNPFFQQRLGDVYVGIGNYDEARACYEKTVSLLEKSAFNDRKEKIEDLKRLIAKLPTALAEITELLKQNRYAEAVSLCKKRTALNPGDVTAVTYMGVALEELDEWPQAEKLYMAAIKLNSDYPTPHYYLGRLFLIKRKNSAKAIEEIENFKNRAAQLLEIDKNAAKALVQAHHTLVYIYHEILRDYKKAVAESKSLLKLAPEDQIAHYNLGLSYAYLDKKAMAYGEFKKVIAINPDTRIAKDAQSAIESLQKYSSINLLPYRPAEE